MQASSFEAVGPILMGFDGTTELANDPSRVLPFIVMVLSTLLVVFEFLRRGLEAATLARTTFAAGSVLRGQGSQPPLSLLHLALEADLGKGEEHEDIEGGATVPEMQRSSRRLRRQQRRLKQRLLREDLESLAAGVRGGARIVPCSGQPDENAETETFDNVEQPALVGMVSEKPSEHMEAETSDIAEEPAHLCVVSQQETSSWGCLQQRVYSNHLLLAHRELGLRICSTGAPGLQPHRLTERRLTPTTTSTASLGGESAAQEARASSDRECIRPKASAAITVCGGQSLFQFDGSTDASTANKAAAATGVAVAAAASDQGDSFVYRPARVRASAAVSTGHMHHWAQQQAMGQPRQSKWRVVSDRRTSNVQACGA